MAFTPALGDEREVALSAGRLRYRERGSGPPVVLVHGLLANADLWRDVVPHLADAGLRTLAPDWPLGAHAVPMPEAPLDPPAVAGLIEEFLEALDLHDVTVVANDTGGALVQMLMARRPVRVARVVLTPSDSFERFLPPVFALLPLLARSPALLTLVCRALQVRALHRLPLVFGWLAKRPIPGDVAASFTRPALDPGVRSDLARFLRGVHRRHTLAAAETLPAFDRPVLLAWSVEDRHFPFALAGRLAARLPDARIAPVDDAYTFVPLDRPERLAALVVDFVHMTAEVRPAATVPPAPAPAP